MAIKEIRWQNFRSFRDTGWLEIRPITVLIGSNNSGKSSILNPLLLLKQTLDSNRPQSPLVLRGELINAGSFSDIVHGHDSSADCTFAIRFHERPSPESSVPELGVSAPSVAEFTFKAEKAPGVVSLQRYTVHDSFDRVMLERERARTRNYSLSNIQDWARDESPIDSVDLSDDAARKAISEAVPYHFLFDPEPIFNDAVTATHASVANPGTAPREGDEKKESLRNPVELSFSSFVTTYVAIVGLVEQRIGEALEEVFYVGPLRDRPKRLYEVSGDVPSNVGVRGQFCPEILFRARKRRLFNDVNRWLHNFGLPGDLSFRQLTETAFQLDLMTREDTTSRTNFADVGFGFSQLLPLIVQGLIGGKGKLLIAEQPEIHLNPRLQASLADFFVEAAANGGSTLIETHSEHLLLSLRRLVAEGKIPAEDVAIYFTERAENGSTVRRVPLQQNGHVESTDWPKGFFEDSIREAFALASAQARRKIDAS